MGRHRAIRPPVVALLAVALALGACTAPPATVEADRVQGLYNLFLIAAAVVFVVVAGLIGWNIVRYRARGDGSLPVQTSTNLALELLWWALPTLLVIGLFIASAAVLNTNARAPCVWAKRITRWASRRITGISACQSRFCVNWVSREFGFSRIILQRLACCLMPGSKFWNKFPAKLRQQNTPSITCGPRRRKWATR